MSSPDWAAGTADLSAVAVDGSCIYSRPYSLGTRTWPDSLVAGRIWSACIAKANGFPQPFFYRRLPVRIGRR